MKTVEASWTCFSTWPRGGEEAQFPFDLPGKGLQHKVELPGGGRVTRDRESIFILHKEGCVEDRFRLRRHAACGIVEPRLRSIPGCDR